MGGGRTGVSQRLERKNYQDTISYLRLVLSPLTSTQEHFEARELHATHLGRFCPAETPEGPTIGLRKHLSLLAEITKGMTLPEKKKITGPLKLSDKGVVVLADGVPIGCIEDPEKFVKDIKTKRRNGSINREVNVAYYPHMNEVRINMDAGRVRRPLIIVESGRPILGEEKEWTQMIKDGIIEYLDAEEEDTILVSMFQDQIKANTTHLEISPLAILGTSASLIPFPQHDRGDRVNLGAKMIGQSMGLYQANFMLRTDTKSNIMLYPQSPLVETDTSGVLDLDNHPTGHNIIIALIGHRGYNMEDGVIINKASLDRGMFRSIFYRIYTGEEKRYWGGQEDKIGMPDKDVRGYRNETEYARLGEDGILNAESPVHSDDVLVGRTSPLRFLSTNELMSGTANMRETSVALRHGECGIVDRIFLTETINGNKLVKIAVRDCRIPELGDKFSSRHGQKGVVGLIVDETNLPFTSSGITPDVILNPHSIPSRQTIGQLLEILAAKTGSLSGRKIDASAFKHLDETQMRNTLRELGFRSDGKECMYNGITGEKYDVEIFIGQIFYQRLDHMVANKLQARSRGPVTLLTRQPTEGKAKEGGLRLGEMEKDCLIAHGAVLTLNERFSLDNIVVPICKECGLAACWDKAKEKYVCPACKDSEVQNTTMSYAFKLLLDELKTMLIYPKLKVAE